MASTTPTTAVTTTVDPPTTVTTTVDPPTTTVSLPVITSDPSDLLLVVEGTTVEFSVTAEGVGLTYQWKNGAGDLILGATLATLTIMNVGLSDVGGYSVQVSNSAGNVDSLTANLITSKTAFCVCIRSLIDYSLYCSLQLPSDP